MSIEDHALSGIVHPNLQRLYAYWEERRAGRTFPSRADISPQDFAFVLGDLSLIDVLYDPLRFRIRLQGSNTVMRLGYELTGRFADDIPDPEYRRLTLNTYRRVVEGRRPIREVREQTLDRKVHRYEAIWLPLAADGATVDMIMVCVAMFSR